MSRPGRRRWRAGCAALPPTPAQPQPDNQRLLAPAWHGWGLRAASLAAAFASSGGFRWCGASDWAAMPLGRRSAQRFDGATLQCLGTSAPQCSSTTAPQCRSAVAPKVVQVSTLSPGPSRGYPPYPSPRADGSTRMPEAREQRPASGAHRQGTIITSFLFPFISFPSGGWCLSATCRNLFIV